MLSALRKNKLNFKVQTKPVNTLQNDTHVLSVSRRSQYLPAPQTVFGTGQTPPAPDTDGSTALSPRVYLELALTLCFTWAWSL